jgi:hypothetical protein
MADNEKGESFFRKVARFVTNPTTDWTDISTRQEDTRELDLEKSELKAMIERKRRNDFVRKREFDMLRRVRREGLSPEQLAALGGNSRLDDSEVRNPRWPRRCCAICPGCRTRPPAPVQRPPQPPCRHLNWRLRLRPRQCS